MKKLIVFFPIALSVMGFGTRSEAIDFIAPHFETPARSVEESSTQAKSSFAFDPIIAINKNRGAFSTQISVELPRSLLPIGSLKLLYQSEQGENLGMGTGWRWDLPLITPSVRPYLRVPFTVSGRIGNYDLTRTSDHLGKLQPVLEKISKRVFRDTPSIFEPYRPMLEERYTLFVRVLKDSQTVLGWIALLTDGTRWTFSPQGIPIEFSDLFENTVALNWSDGVLRSIKEVSSQGNTRWTAEFNYDSRTQKLPSYTPMGFYTLPLGLRSVQIGERELEFFNDTEGFLTQASWKGGILPLFQGKYEAPAGTGRVETRPNELSRHDDKLPFRLTRKSEVQYATVPHQPDLIQYYTDLNSDGRTDRIQFNVSAGKEVLHSIWKQCDNLDKDQIEDLKKRLNPPVSSTTYLGIEQRQGITEWIADPSLELPYRFELSSNSLESSGRYCKAFHSTPRAIFFVDVNGDGLKDFIDCGFDDATTAVESEVPNEEFQVLGPDNQPSQVKRKHSNISLALLSITTPSLTAGKSFTNPLDIAGKPARLFIQSANENAIDSWNRLNLGAPPASSSLVGSHLWKEIANPSFACHQGTLFFDANHDGRIDILTGKTLYLASSVSGHYYSLPVDPKDFLDAPRDSLDMADTQLVAADPENKGRLEVFQAHTILPNPETGTIDVFSNGKTYSFAPRPAGGKLLSEMRSAFGGSVKLQYRFQSGAWVVEKWDKKVGGNQPDIQTQLNYSGKMHDEFRGLFTGFQQVRETTTVSDPRIAPRTHEEEFYRDINPLAGIFSSRARLSGLSMTSRELDTPERGQAGHTWSERTRQLAAIQLGDQRILPFYSVTDQVLYKKGTLRVLDRKKTTLRYAENSEDWVLDSRGARLLPLKNSVEEIGMGIQSPHSDQLLEARSFTQFQDRYFPELQVLRPQTKHETDKDDIQYRADFLLDSDETTSLPKKACWDERCKEFKFDTLGRLSEVRDSRGGFEIATYSGGDPLPETITTPDGKESRGYELLTGRLVFQGLPTGAVIQRKYSSDGLLFEATTQENLASRQALAFQLFNGKPPTCSAGGSFCELPRNVPFQIFDRKETLELDRFGRVESTVVETPQGSLHSGLARFGVQKDVLTQNRPQYERADSGILFSETARDSLGRVIHEQSGVRGSEEYDKTEWSFEGPCSFSKGLDTYQSSRCVNLFGQVQSQSLGNEELIFESTAGGDLLSVPSLGIRWKPSRHSEISETAASFDDPGMDSAIAKGAAEWALRKQTHTETKDGLETTDSNGWVKRANSSGKLIQAFRKSPGEADTEETRTYDQNRLVSRTITLSKSRKDLLKQDFTSNGFGGTSSWNAFGYRLNLPSDNFGRPSGMQFYDSRGQLLIGLRYQYSAGKISQIELAEKATEGQERWTPWISDVGRDELERIVDYKFSNGTRFQKKFHGLSSRSQSIQVHDGNGKPIFEEVLGYEGRAHEITSRRSSSTLHLDELVQEIFSYDPGSYRLNASLTQVNRDSGGRAKKSGSLTHAWSGDFLTSVGGRTIYYNGDGTWVASCPDGSTDTQECVFRLADDAFLIHGKPVILIRLESLPAAVFTPDGIFPLISDHLGSVRGLLDSSGSLVWERHYDAWGKKKVFLKTPEVKASEESILWSFAGLVEQPGVVSSMSFPLYWSKTRVYSPELKEWLSVDPQVRWNPGKLLKAPGNWHAVRYAMGRPLEFIDPQGSVVTLAPAAGAAMVGFAVGFGGSLALGHTTKEAFLSASAVAVGTFVTVATAGMATGLMAAGGAGVVTANATGMLVGGMVGIPSQAAFQAATTGTTNFTSLLGGSIGSTGTLALNLLLPEFHGTQAVVVEMVKAYMQGVSGMTIDGFLEMTEKREKEMAKNGSGTYSGFTMPEFGDSYKSGGKHESYSLFSKENSDSNSTSDSEPTESPKSTTSGGDKNE